jgi:hypothetical protein
VDGSLESGCFRINLIGTYVEIGDGVAALAVGSGSPRDAGTTIGGGYFSPWYGCTAAICDYPENGSFYGLGVRTLVGKRKHGKHSEKAENDSAIAQHTHPPYFHHLRTDRVLYNKLTSNARTILA